MELIKITETNGKKVVSARELHNFLEISERFNNWFERQLQFGFIENVDYLGCKVFNTQARQELQDYALTIDTAKEISMIQRSEKGKQARRYFIECEKKLINNIPAIPQSYSEALKLAYEQSLKIEQQQQLINDQKPMVLFAEALQISKHSILIGEMAKILKQNNINIGQNRLFDWLRSNRYLISKGEQRNLPSQKGLELGLFEVKTTTINNSDGSVRVTKTTKITPKGQSYIINKFLK